MQTIARLFLLGAALLLALPAMYAAWFRVRREPAVGGGGAESV